MMKQSWRTLSKLEKIFHVHIFIFKGQILNRFSRDIFQMDDELPWKSFDAVAVSLINSNLLITNKTLTFFANKLVLLLEINFIFSQLIVINRVAICRDHERNFISLFGHRNCSTVHWICYVSWILHEGS